ncbi:hypothetical protein C8R47DRAFT_999075 [Mycena vitilis]|nr:hypothetical protein C8R47DRAFT_999499 [Mycena vitilis]KAJ6449909.1 hypothetical protein C8R47DRAFT_999075 [Mycena vitilis]
MHQSSFTQACLVCGLPTTRWCSRCRDAFYCSDEHMLANWSVHRPVCQRATQGHPYHPNMITMPPPAERGYCSVDAVLFHPEEARSKIITVDCSPPHRPSLSLCPVPYLTQYFDTPYTSLVITEGVSGEPLRFPLHFFYSLPVSEPERCLPTNRAILRIAPGTVWYGHVVVLKFSGSRLQGYTDAGSNDLPVLSTYFLLHQ